MPLDQHSQHCVYNPQAGQLSVRCRCNGPRWTVVATWPQAETWAAANLQRSGFTTYLPLIAIARRDRATPTLRHTVLVPLFAGYLFVQHDPRESWTPIRTTPGVRAMLRNGHQLQYASEASVSVLQAGEDARRTTPTSPVAQLAPGASVAVLDGPFRGRQGAIVAISHDRAVVSVMVFGRLQDVHMPVASLVPTGEIV